MIKLKSTIDLKAEMNRVFSVSVNYCTVPKFIRLA